MTEIYWAFQIYIFFLQVHSSNIKRDGSMGPLFLSEQNRRLVKQRTGYIKSQCCEEIVSDDGRVTSLSSLTRRSQLIKPQRGSNIAVRVIITPWKESFFLLQTMEWIWWSHSVDRKDPETASMYSHILYNQP